MREKPCKKDPKKVLSHQSDSFLEGWTPSFSHLVFSWFWDRLKSQTGWDWLIVKASYSLHPHLHQPQWGLMDGEAAVIWWPSVTRCSKRTNRPKTRQQLEPTDPTPPTLQRSGSQTVKQVSLMGQNYSRWMMRVKIWRELDKIWNLWGKWVIWFNCVGLQFTKIKLGFFYTAAVGDVDGLHLLESEVFPFNCQMLMFCCLFVFNVQQKEEP